MTDHKDYITDAIIGLPQKVARLYIRNRS